MTKILFFVNIYEVGDSMYYIIEENNESKKNRIILNDKEMYISIDNILILNNVEKTIEHMVNTSEYLKMLRFNNDMLNIIIEAVIYDIDTNSIINKLSQMNFPLFSISTGYINNLKKKYQKLKEINEGSIVIKCNKDNFIKCLKFAKNINNKVIILEAKNISLGEYKELLSSVNLNELNNPNITISYQDTTRDLNIKELYNLSLLIDEVAKKINKYNLSPLEKIVYVYDYVKKREYHECEDKTNSRDLDKVINGENIVCVGYSNLFNAILKSLNISCIPLISIKAKHQRSLVYVKDDKYNINGIYAFDPTWDSKKTKAYIDNYNYFAMPFEESEKNCPTELYQKTTTSIDEIIENYQIDLTQDKPISFDKINAIEELFKLTETEGFEEMNNIVGLYSNCSISEKERAIFIYDTFTKKYNPGNIPVEKLFSAIINARIIEYYVGETTDINIDNIKLAISDKYSHTKIYSRDTAIDKLLKAILCDCDIIEELSEYEERNEEEIKRKTLNIRLLKTLTNKQK